MAFDLTKTVTVNEIFYSIQGESYLAGLPCIFIRLTGCDQRCVYCDTEYAFYEGEKISFSDILSKIKEYPCDNVLMTGGEPLLQSNTLNLIEVLLDQGYQVSVETSGGRDVSGVPKKANIIMDLKTPSSGEEKRNNLDNLTYLKKTDEIKFVVMNEADISWALDMTREKKLTELCHVSLSPVQRELNIKIADGILNSGLKVRQQNQLHKIIWPDQKRGV